MPKTEGPLIMTEAYRKEGMHEKIYDLEQKRIWNTHLSVMDLVLDV